MLNLLLHLLLFPDIFLQVTLSLPEGHWHEDLVSPASPGAAAHPNMSR